MNKPADQQNFSPARTYGHCSINRLSLLVLTVLISAAAAQDELPVPFQAGEKWGYKDRNGSTVIAPHYLIALPFSGQGLAAVVDDSGWVYINRQGEKLIRPYVFDNGPDYFSEGLARYVSDGKFGFFDEYGHIVIPAVFLFAGPFSEGLAAFCEACEKKTSGEHSTYQGGRWGYMNKQGRIVIGARFDQVSLFKDSTATVSVNGKIYLIDKAGRFLHWPAE